jgi:hypothetical protein
MALKKFQCTRVCFCTCARVCLCTCMRACFVYMHDCTFTHVLVHMCTHDLVRVYSACLAYVQAPDMHIYTRVFAQQPGARHVVYLVKLSITAAHMHYPCNNVNLRHFSTMEWLLMVICHNMRTLMRVLCSQEHVILSHTITCCRHTPHITKQMLLSHKDMATCIET